MDAGKGINKYSAEICFDSYVEGRGYTNWIVDEYGGAGTKIKETKCVSNRCAQEEVTCSDGYFLDKDGHTFPKNRKHSLKIGNYLNQRIY